MEKIDRKIKDGIILHLMKTGDRFKTNYIAINILLDLKREDVTKNSLTSLVLRRGTSKYPTMKDISIKLEDMYGATFDADVDKLGDRLVMQFVMDSISNDYTLNEEDVLLDGLELISDAILNPVLENDIFKEEYVEQEKDTLKEIINSKINDKGSYAQERAVEEMYKDEPYGIYKFGYVEDLENITPETLYEHYLKILESGEFHIYISGSFDDDKVFELLNNKFSKVNRNYVDKNEKLEKEFIKKDNPSEVIEHQNVTQGKLVLGYKLDSQSLKDDFYKMTVYSAILGGTASSKLFNNVREKKSLAYTIRSQYIKHKGAMFASAGIELENYDLAKECILKEINDMRIGEITEEELNAAKVNLVTRYKSLNDSQLALIGWSIGQKLLGGDEDLNVAIDKINEITIQDVVEVANRLHLDTTYYLTA